ncbi:uncharacterized protein LOC143192477 isoform X2 [Rhynchophorus ferrugineus]|uniref:uncharacterized protein LOC143192477 isoform X2 n=1 Tax=Rhynchophorus ferrugineus TaxID=354439 RepID=UPI003FCC81CF
MLTKGWNVKRGENFFQLYLLRVCCSWLPGPERRCTSFLMKHEKNEISIQFPPFCRKSKLPIAQKTTLYKMLVRPVCLYRAQLWYTNVSSDNL